MSCVSSSSSQKEFIRPRRQGNNNIDTYKYVGKGEDQPGFVLHKIDEEIGEWF